MPKQKDFYSRSFWRYITNIWTILFIGLAMSDFLSLGKYHYLIAPFSVIYGAVLSIFVGTKEFDRWYDMHQGKKHPGEIFVIMWSFLLLVMVSISWIYGGLYTIPSDLISVYIMVLTVFAITQSSKAVYQRKRGKK
jgi:hypothetical protein